VPDALAVIPARWASTRFPGKVLAPLGGRPLFLWVADAARASGAFRSVIVATDDDRVAEVAREAGLPAVLTSPGLPSGTDRVAAVARERDEAIVLGLQADEPFVEPGDLAALVETLAGAEDVALATLARPIGSLEEYLDPDVVKVVLDEGGRALLFSRAPIPWPREDGGIAFPPRSLPDPPPLAHVGIYAWRREALLSFAGLAPSRLERTEKLEQLRALEAGWAIRVLPAHGEPLGVDTPRDLARAEAHLAARREDDPGATTERTIDR